MSITTKTGDKGQTSLYSGERVWKDDLRVDAYGTLDELDAHIGDAKHYLEEVLHYDQLTQLQNTLYRVMGQLATRDGSYPHPICERDVDEITAQIHLHEAGTPLHGFVIPGSTPASAKLDICRTIARRAERRVTALARQEEVAPELRQYVNRLSDFLFMLARAIEAAAGAIRYKTKPHHGNCKPKN
jgi:ATP:cob(I)alamin adenosyltransferase